MNLCFLGAEKPAPDYAGGSTEEASAPIHRGLHPSGATHPPRMSDIDRGLHIRDNNRTNGKTVTFSPVSDQF